MSHKWMTLGAAALIAGSAACRTDVVAEEPEEGYAWDEATPAAGPIDEQRSEAAREGEPEGELTPFTGPVTQEELEAEGWILLGQHPIDGTAANLDHDNIVLSAAQQEIEKIVLFVDDAPVDLREVKITFADGSTYVPHYRHVIPEGARSYALHLPESGKVKTISFSAANVGEQGMSTITVWGK